MDEGGGGVGRRSGGGAGGLAAVNRPAFLALRRVLKLLVGPPVRLLRGLRVERPDRLPTRRRPLILAVNHAAFVDSFYLIVAVRPRFTICGAKPRLFRNPALRLLMAVANILRVDDREQFLRDTTALLAAGEVILVYPEMRRNPQGMARFETWAAEAALQSGAPLLPCYLYGTTWGNPGPPRLYVGREIEPAGSPEALTSRLRRAIAILAPPFSPVGWETW